MPNALNITNIPAPRVNFIDERTGLMSREWYRFFLNLFVLTGSGSNPTSLEDLQLAPAFEFTQNMLATDNLSPNAESLIAALEMSVLNLRQELQTQNNADTAIAALELSVINLRQELQTQTNSDTAIAALTNLVFDINQNLQTQTVNSNYILYDGPGSFSSLAYSTTLTGGTGIVNLGSGQFYKDVSGNVGIGTIAPASLFHADNGFITTGRYASQSGTLILRSAAGTQAAPTAIASAFTLSNLTTRGYDGAAYRDVATIFVASDGAVSSTSSPGFMAFSTTPSTTITPLERMRIDSAGNVNVGASNTTAAGSLRFFDVYNAENTSSVSGVDIRLVTRNVAGTANVTVDLVKYKNGSFNINNNETDVNAYTAFGVGGVERFRVTGNGSVLLKSAGGLGYGTGSGGAVTQLTSRATGVTLNKTNGAITMFSAAGSATAATFTVTNSTVVATDTIVLSVKSSTNVYLMFVTAVAAGSFNITFQTTGGVAVDAPVINYAVIKAVTA